MFLVAATPRRVFVAIALACRFLNHDAMTETTRSRYRSRCCVVALFRRGSSFFATVNGGQKSLWRSGWLQAIMRSLRKLAIDLWKLGGMALGCWLSASHGERLREISGWKLKADSWQPSFARRMWDVGPPANAGKSRAPDTMPQAFLAVVLRCGVLGWCKTRRLPSSIAASHWGKRVCPPAGRSVIRPWPCSFRHLKCKFGTLWGGGVPFSLPAKQF